MTYLHIFHAWTTSHQVQKQQFSPQSCALIASRTVVTVTHTSVTYRPRTWQTCDMQLLKDATVEEEWHTHTLSLSENHVSDVQPWHEVRWLVIESAYDIYCHDMMYVTFHDRPKPNIKPFLALLFFSHPFLLFSMFPTNTFSQCGNILIQLSFSFPLHRLFSSRCLTRRNLQHRHRHNSATLTASTKTKGDWQISKTYSSEEPLAYPAVNQN